VDPYTPIGQLMPKTIRLKARQQIRYSSLQIDPEKFLGFALVMGLLVGYVVASAAAHYKLLSLGVAYAVSFTLVEVVFYVWIILSADSKAKFVEEVLPDALQLMSSNIRAGLTTDKAFLRAARPEFGPLEQEIRRVGKETMTGKTLAESLEKIKDHIRSQNLNRAVDLINQSMKSGGKLADLLDETAEDLRSQQIVQREITASVLMYAMFIFIAIGIGAPALFAMSSFLVNILTQNIAMITKEMPANAGDMQKALPIAITEVKISADFIKTYAVLSLMASSFFGSLVIGLILNGEETQGFKYFPLLAAVSIGLFFIGSYVLQITLGGMMKTV